MKTLEEIELEYFEYAANLSTCNSLTDLHKRIKRTSIDIDDDILEIIKVKIGNIKNRLVNKVILSLDSFADIDLNYYKNDFEILTEAENLMLNYRAFLSELMHIANEENYKEVYKLLSYMMNVDFKNNLAYLEYKRDTNYFITKNIYFCNSKYIYSFTSFKEFFAEKIKELSLIAPIVKEKKI